MPALSVLLPVRDAAPWLGAALGSLARQTFRDYEVVAVDDGSTDDSVERLRRAAEREPRLRVFARPHAGLPATLAFALREARAPLIARHDADDLSHRERFALQLARLAARRAATWSAPGCGCSRAPRPAPGCGAGPSGTTRCSPTRRWSATRSSTARSPMAAR